MEIYKTFRSFIQERPLNVIIWKAYCRAFKKCIPDFDSWRSLVVDRDGLEVGGPSSLFSSDKFFPIYPYIKSLDGVNFSTKTIWEGDLRAGENFRFGDRTGRQIIADGTELSSITESTYDFVLSCNNLEHIANPIKALFEWKKLLKPGGAIILIVPRNVSNFDHARAITAFEHLRNDYESQTGEDDLTHLDEVLKLHDLSRDPHAGSFEKFQIRAKNNFENRSIHHHVFDIELLKQIFNFIGMSVLKSYSSPTDHYVAATKFITS
jgi:SAM-dependent methyltransferase